MRCSSTQFAFCRVIPLRDQSSARSLAPPSSAFAHCTRRPSLTLVGIWACLSGLGAGVFLCFMCTPEADTPGLSRSPAPCRENGKGKGRRSQAYGLSKELLGRAGAGTEASCTATYPHAAGPVSSRHPVSRTPFETPCIRQFQHGVSGLLDGAGMSTHSLHPVITQNKGKFRCFKG